MKSKQQNRSQTIKEKLNRIVSEPAENPTLFVVHPGKDFIRNTPLHFENTVQAILQMGGQALNKELYDFMKQRKKTVSVSAFVRQIAKVLPEAFEYLFHEFNNQTNEPDTQNYDGYKIYAVDGSDVCFSANPLSDTYMKAGNYNMYHMNAIYDILNHTYKDLMIEPKTTYSEPGSCRQMAERSLRGEPCILLCDRGYGGVNLFEHINRCDQVEYLIRVRNQLFKEFRGLPMEEFDSSI